MVSFVPVSVSTWVLPPVFRAHRPDDGGRNDAHVRQNKGNSQQPDRRLRGGAVEVAALRRVPLRTVRFLQVCGSISRKYDVNFMYMNPTKIVCEGFFYSCFKKWYLLFSQAKIANFNLKKR